MRNHQRPHGLAGVILVLCARLSFAEPLASDDPPPAPALTLESAWQLTVRHHPELRAAAAQREATAALERQAAAVPNPELSAQIEDDRAASRTTTLLWNQPVEWAGKRSARIDAAQWALKQADTAVQARVAQVRAQLIMAFHGVSTAQERLRNADEMRRIARQAHQTASKRVSAGEVPPIEAVKGQVAMSQAESAYRAADSQHQVAWQWLRHAVGSDLGGVERLQPDESGQWPSPARWTNLDALVDRATLTQHAEQEVSRQRALAEVERTRARPDVVLQWGVKRDAGRHLPVIGVSLPLALWDQNQGAIAAALSHADQAEAALASTRATVRAQASEARAQLGNAVEQARALRDTVLPAARQALDIANRGYELGKFGILDVLDAQRTLADIHQQLLMMSEQAVRADARLIELFGDVALSSAPSHKDTP